MLDNVQAFCERLAGTGDEPTDGDWSPGRDMTVWIARMAIDIIGGLYFGQVWIEMDGEKKRELVEAIPAGTKGFLMVCSFFFPFRLYCYHGCSFGFADSFFSL